MLKGIHSHFKSLVGFLPTFRLGLTYTYSLVLQLSSRSPTEYPQNKRVAGGSRPKKPGISQFDDPYLVTTIPTFDEPLVLAERNESPQSLEAPRPHSRDLVLVRQEARTEDRGQISGGVEGSGQAGRGMTVGCRS